ncbi:hypothetical protein PRIPAC_73085, partial [Pristionchus pacificus]|uniref:Uncharacterized protein n=1 Tax=Pristionchus pacificus TaxID=54126 RepID=A0A2A6C093_PRIPA
MALYFLSLPQRVIINICHFADNETLLLLREVCNQTKDAVDTLANRCNTTINRCIIYSSHVSNSKLDSLIINSLNFEIREAVSEFFDRASIDGVCVWPFPNEVLDLSYWIRKISEWKARNVSIKNITRNKESYGYILHLAEILPNFLAIEMEEQLNSSISLPFIREILTRQVRHLSLPQESLSLDEIEKITELFHHFGKK